MQFVELRRHLAPDALLLRRVVDDRRPEAAQPVLPAQREQLVAPRDIGRVADSRVHGLEFEPVRIGGFA